MISTLSCTDRCVHCVRVSFVDRGPCDGEEFECEADLSAWVKTGDNGFRYVPGMWTDACPGFEEGEYVPVY